MPSSDQPRPSLAGPSPSLPNTTATILVVEDSRTLNMAVCEVLTAQGYIVLPAYDGLQALNVLHQQPVDLVLSDIVMPHLDGYGLLQAIRAEERFRYLPVVFLTGYATPDDRRRAKDSGVEDYLAKPLDDDDLLATVRNVLSRREVLEAAVQRQVEAVRSQILGLMQHEFRTPLTFVMGYAEFLQSALGHAPESAELQHSVEAILEGGRRLHHLIESFLTLAGLSETALHPGDLYPLEPMALWRECIAVMQPTLDRCDLQIHFEDPAQSLEVYGAPDLVREALLRLLDNAIAYRRPESRTIRLAAATQPGYVGWIIQDDGMGIPADQVATLVQPFARMPRSPTGNHGAGLGLPLAQRVAQMHNGFLSVESQKGVGSTFGFWISDAEPNL